jgi:hypothetical protein
LFDGLGGSTLRRVTTAAEKVLEDALKLDESERARVAAELLASLDAEVDEDAEAASAEEIERRAQRARSGEDAGRPWPEVRERIRQELARR